jgi:hypothetical protein
MTRTTLRTAAAALLLTAAAALPAHAQISSPIKFNVRAGAALPMSDFGDYANTGFTLGGGLTLRAPLMPVALRVDGDYNRFALDTDLTNEDVSIWAITANAQVAPALSPIYFIGGAGMYSMSAFDESETDFGLNGGAGLRIPLTGFNTFVEARYHHVFTKDDADPNSSNTQYLPIVFGVEF